MTYRLFCKCDDGTQLLTVDAREPVQKGTPLFFNAEKAGVVLETIGSVEKPLVVARIAKKFADETEFL
ncbi:MAG: hypothetical protein WC408_04660 [Candidatus Micrarchaeia archaeon]|jgi:rRNA processing protein Gar1